MEQKKRKLIFKIYPYLPSVELQTQKVQWIKTAWSVSTREVIFHSRFWILYFFVLRLQMGIFWIFDFHFSSGIISTSGSSSATFLILLYLLLVAQSVKNLPALQVIRVQFLGQEDPLEMEMAGYSPWGHKGQTRLSD